MVLIRNNVTKESTYGWYPPQQNVYQNPRANHGYDKECLFNFWKSGLLGAAGSPAPITPPEFRPSPHIKPQATSRCASSRGSIRTGYTGKHRAASSKRSQPLDLTVCGSNTMGLNIRQRTPTPNYLDSPPSGVARIPTPNVTRGHHGWRPQPTIIGVVDPTQSFIAKSPQLELDDVALPEDVTVEDTYQQVAERAMTPAQRISRASRAQSAALSRPKITSSRSVQSAKARSSQATSSVSITLEKASDDQKPSETYLKQLKHEIDSLDGEEVVEEIERPPTPVNLRTPSPTVANNPTYEEQIDKYGWIAEVHGDPLNLKVISERLPYTVKCPEPQVAESPYKTKVSVGETFFFNTIPRRKMTFTVHPEWQSEQFVEQRKALEKTGKKFHTRNFGFVY